MSLVRVSAIASRLRASAPRLPSAAGAPDGVRLVLIDGPAGSGKTTLAARLAIELGGRAPVGAGGFDPADPTPADLPVDVLHADDMYEGWEGLDALDDVLIHGVLEPLAAGRPAEFAMWNWERGERTHTIAVPPRPFLIIEGVGVARASARAHAALTVWVEAPRELRLERGLARDGDDQRGEWLRWMEREERHFAADGTRAAADVIIDGSAPLEP